MQELCQGAASLLARPVALARFLGLTVFHCAGYLGVGLAFLAFLHLNQV